MEPAKLMAQGSNTSRISITKWLTALGFITSPIWSGFVNAILKQNEVFNDPNSMISSVVFSILNFVSSPFFTHAATFGLGILICELFSRMLASHRSRDNGAFEGSPLEQKTQILLSLLKSTSRIISDSQPKGIFADDDNAIAGLFDRQRANLESLNVTLHKAGFKRINFQNYNRVERDLLVNIHDEIEALTRDGHIPEAIERATELFGQADFTLDHMDRLRPIRWILEENGSLFCPNHRYKIDGGRMNEKADYGDGDLYSWPIHLASKTWFELDTFLGVFKKALVKSGFGLDEELYARSASYAWRVYRQNR